MSKKTQNYDLVFELHFNTSSSKAEGCEAWYYHRNTKTKKISEIFCEEYSNLTGSRNRGSKELYNKKQRGFGFVKHQKPNAILLEPFFGDNKADCSRFNILSLINSIKKTIKY